MERERTRLASKWIALSALMGSPAGAPALERGHDPILGYDPLLAASSVTGHEGWVLTGALVVAVSVLWVMVTRLRRAQAAMKESEAMFRELFEQAALGVAQVHPKTGRFLQVNSKYCSIVGYSRDELLKMGNHELVHPEDRNLDLEKKVQVFKGERREFSCQKRYIQKNGGVVWVSESVARCRPERREPEGIIAIVQDITALKEAENHLVQTERLVAVGQLSSGIAHEFNNFLMIILGYTELLKLQLPNSREVADACETIGNQVVRGRDVISQLMALANPSKGKAEPIRMSNLIEQVLDIQSESLTLEHVEIVRDLKADVWVRGDRYQLQQVLLNLVVNARHAIQPKGGGRIVIRTTWDGQSLQLEVSDDGCGMNEEAQKRVFTPFFTTKGAYSQNDLGIKGSGLGLAVCLRIVEAHQGRISFESKLGEGTRFILRLPAFEKLEGAEVPRVAVHSPSSITQKPKLLVVDDEPAVCVVLKEMLARCGFEDVETASSGIEALKRVDSRPYDLAFVDLMMPGMGGPDLVKAVQSKQMPIQFVFISGQIDVPEDELMKLGAVGVLYKPFGASQLKELLEKVL